MKFATSQISYFFQNRTAKRNVSLLLRFLGILILLVVAFSTVFHFIMAYEVKAGLREEGESWITGFYWTLTVMSTLGFGDITFVSDLGRMFSITVLLSGIVFLLVLLPFTFIQFFYAPWVESQAAARAPRALPSHTRGHIILTSYGPVARALIRKLDRYGYPYVLLVPGLDEALELHDQGVNVVVGSRDNPASFRAIQTHQAALVAATCSDPVNTNIAMTLREVAPNTTILATAEDHASVDILELAGCNHVFELHKQLGQALARRALGPDSLVHKIGQFDGLVVAEAIIAGTTLSGTLLKTSGIRKKSGLNVVGLWEQGVFKQPGPDSELNAGTVLVLVGSEDQMKRFNQAYMPKGLDKSHVMIVGGGRVGKAADLALQKRGIPSVVVERNPEICKLLPRAFCGNAAELETLEGAGIDHTSSVMVTTSDDDTNIYLTLYFRRLRPDVQIISRATNERNVQTLHRAGANLVMSYASMGANAVFNLLQRSDILMVGEGLDIFRVKLPAQLAGTKLIDSGIRARTGCSVVAICQNGSTEINPSPNQPLKSDCELILLGEIEAEKKFMKLFQ